MTDSANEHVNSSPPPSDAHSSVSPLNGGECSESASQGHENASALDSSGGHQEGSVVSPSSAATNRTPVSLSLGPDGGDDERPQDRKTTKRSLSKRQNYYSRDGLKASSLQGKAVSTQPAIIFHVRRLLYRFVRLYCWRELSHDDRLTSPTHVPIDANEAALTAINIIKMLHIWLEGYSNRESVGLQNMAIVRAVLVKLRHVIVEASSANEVLEEVDEYTGRLIDQLYTNNPNARKSLVYYYNLWKFSVAGRIATQMENTSLRQLYAHSKMLKDMSPEFNCWSALTPKVRREILAGTQRRPCPLDPFKKAELLDAKIQSAKSILIDPLRSEPLTQQLFLYSNLASGAFTDVLGHLKTLEAKDLPWFVDRKTSPFKENDHLIPNVIVLEAVITTRHCRLLNHAQSGQLEGALRAHLGYDDDFDAGGVTLTDDVTRLKECLDDIEYLQDEVLRYIRHVRDDPYSVAAGVFGRACSYTSLLNYISSVLDDVSNRQAILDCQSGLPKIDVDEHLPLRPMKCSRLFPCLHQFLHTHTRKCIVSTVTEGRVATPALWIVLLVLTIFDGFAVHEASMRSLLSDILACRWCPIEHTPSQSSSPTMSAFLIILTVGQYVVNECEMRNLFKLLHRIAQRVSRLQCMTSGKGLRRTPEWEGQRRLLGSEERAFKELVMLCINRLQSRFATVTTEETPLRTGDADFDQFWLLLMSPLFHEGTTMEVLYQCVQYGFEQLAS